MNYSSLLSRIEALRSNTLMLSNRLHDTETSAGGTRPATDVTTQLIADLSVAVEELHVAEEELQQQNEALAGMQGAIESERRRYQDLFDFAPDAYFVTDARGVILEANHAVAALVGFARRYTLGKPLSAFVGSADQQLFQTRLTRLQSANGAGVQEWELQMRPRRHEVTVHASVRVAPVRDPEGTLNGFRWMVRDITQIKRAELEIIELNAQLEKRVVDRTAQLESAHRVNAALLEQEQGALAAAREQYERMIAGAREGMFRATADGRLQMANPAMALLLGYDAPQALMRADRDAERLVLDPARRAELLGRLLSENALYGVEVDLRRADGSELRVSLNAWTVRDARGAVVALEGTALPATDGLASLPTPRIPVGVAQLDAPEDASLTKSGRLLSIAEAARAIGVGTDALRVWVEEGLLTATNSTDGELRFSAEDIDRTRRALGFKD